MKDNLLLGLGRSLWPIPSLLWRRQVQQNGWRNAAGRAFMTPDHTRIHHFVVAELPRCGRPLTAEHIAGALGLPLERVIACLDDLEQHLTFLFRNPQGEVVWAYPVTVEATPHRIEFKSGEKLYAA